MSQVPKKTRTITQEMYVCWHDNEKESFDVFSMRRGDMNLIPAKLTFEVPIEEKKD